MWGYLIVLIISYAVSYALAPKPPEPSPASLSDIEAPTAEEGRPIPVVFGTVFISSPNVVWYGNLGTTPITSSTGK
jgi:hypothetical protein